MRKSRKFLALSGVVLVAGLLLVAPTTLRANETKTIVDGVYIGNVSVGGMTSEEATAAVENYIAEVGTVEITLNAGEKSTTVTAEELGISFSDMSVIEEAMDVTRGGNLIKRYKDMKDLEKGDKVIEMSLSVDSEIVASLLEEKADELNQEAIDNGLIRENGEFVIVKGEQGIVVNVEESIAVIEGFVQDGWDGTGAEISLVAEIAEPRGSEEELSQITDLLGGFSTTYRDSNSNRCTNISVAAGHIDGTILYPGDEFSVADTIGPLDASNGYKLAGAYENGQTVESYGGGVCQVSSTLYNAVMLAELEITERANHSMIVSYVKPSMDAAIAGDYKDLCFKNNLEGPIYIEGYTVGKQVFFNIYGNDVRPENREVKYESEVISRQDPGIQFVATGDPAGHIAVAQSAHVGYVARLWKVVTVDGVEESREVVNKSTYKASPKIVHVGTASADPNVSAAIGAAIATGDEATVYAAVAPYTANASAVINPAPAVTPAPTTVTPQQPQQAPVVEQPQQTTENTTTETTPSESQTTTDTSPVEETPLVPTTPTDDAQSADGE